MRRRTDNRCPLQGFLVLLAVTAATAGSAPDAPADPIYKHVDSSGRVTFSSVPDQTQDTPVELPRVYRESTASRVERLKAATPPSCDQHGGIDCTQGPDKDGSVICLDGFRDAALPFQDNCTQARLELQEPVFTDRNGNDVRVSELKPGMSVTAVKVRAALRNLTGVPASGIEIAARQKMQLQDVDLHGPDSIEAFGIGEYTGEFQPAWIFRLVPNEPRSGKGFLRVKCGDCTTVLGAR